MSAVDDRYGRVLGLALCILLVFTQCQYNKMYWLLEYYTVDLFKYIFTQIFSEGQIISPYLICYSSHVANFDQNL